MFHKSNCSSLINTVMKYLNFHSNGSTSESVTWHFTKNRTPSQVFFKEFYCKRRRSKTVLKDSCKDIFITNSKFTYFCISYCDVMLKRREFLWIFSGKGFHEKCKHTEIALNIIQKQYFGSKNRFSFHYSRITTRSISKKSFLKF